MFMSKRDNYKNKRFSSEEGNISNHNVSIELVFSRPRCEQNEVFREVSQHLKHLTMLYGSSSKNCLLGHLLSVCMAKRKCFKHVIKSTSSGRVMKLGMYVPIEHNKSYNSTGAVRGPCDSLAVLV